MSIEKELELAYEYLPEGYCIVPIEPTDEMCKFAEGSINKYLANAIYKAMIKAFQEE